MKIESCACEIMILSTAKKIAKIGQKFRKALPAKNWLSERT